MNVEEYRKKMFTEKGVKAFENYLVTLIQISQKNKYPHNQGFTVGLLNLKFTQVIHSKEEMKGRIKAIATILGIKEVTTELDTGTKITYRLEE